MEIAGRIRLVRKSLGETQAVFAKRLGVKVLAITRYETGSNSPGIDVLIKFRKNINVDINWLLTGDGEMYGKESGYDQKVVAMYPGEVVQLAQGGPAMVVISSTHTQVTCVWHDANGILQQAELPKAAVKPKNIEK